MPGVTPEEEARLLGSVLKGTSRAFYLTLWVLPDNLRKPLGLAYLLARAADTITDTKTASNVERLERLLEFRGLVEGKGEAGDIDPLVRKAGKGLGGAERELVGALPETLAMLESLGEMDRFRVRQVVVTLTQGMELDLTYFREDGVTGFQTAEELDEYTYLVAGCVGRFWTEMCMAHNPRLGGWDAEEMSEKGVRFGKALQLTNILRDVPRDLQLGRCYLPLEVLERCGLSGEQLLETKNSDASRPALEWGISRTLEHYKVAAEYLQAIPRKNYRLRLAVSWPLLMGLGTLGELSKNKGWLDPKRRSKVSRGWVYRMMAASVVKVMSNGTMNSWISGLRGEVQGEL